MRLRLAILAAVILIVPACGGGSDTTIINQVGPASGTILAITDNNILINVSTTAPSTVISAVALGGLQPGESILAIDYRPADGHLYGLGSTSRLYQIFPVSGACLQIGAAGAFTLSGTAFGFDFNPTVDRIRVVSDTGQNLRLNPDTGAIAGTDTPLNGGATAAVAVAYSNNVAGAATTTLYDIDSGTDSLYIQNPPNTGTLTLVGALGVDTFNSVGFDISASGTAYASLSVAGFPELYTINLTTGAATLVGPLGLGALIRGMTIVP
ncbi:MAG TPA: DUF4394 domain-containing protein [Planctomycetota bacterium]|jgi:hypothetical protein|nr:DUF4394 domain-containing protein [Planctomycetota bacterium]